jgi:hypothetical protein
MAASHNFVSNRQAKLYIFTAAKAAARWNILNGVVIQEKVMVTEKAQRHQYECGPVYCWLRWLRVTILSPFTRQIYISSPVLKHLPWGKP